MQMHDEMLATEPVELDFAGHVLLSGFRAHVVGRSNCPLVRQQFTQLCGALADRTLDASLLVLRLLALRSRRRLHVHLPGYTGISGDEMLLLSAVADALARGDVASDPACSWMVRLTGGVYDPPLERAVENLAAALSGAGLSMGRIEPPQSSNWLWDHCAVQPTVH